MTGSPAPPIVHSAALGPRAEDVFDAVLHGRCHTLHPDDRREATEFWEWLGTMERPDAVADTRSRSWRLAGMAAAATLVMVLTGLFFWQLPGTSNRAFAETYKSERAERRTMRLTDGSVITLAPSSEIEIRYARNERRVRLVRGQSLFEVATDAARPFIVEVAQGEVRAVGTAFDVVARPNRADVTVIEGEVRISLVAADGERAAVIRQARMGDIVRFGTNRVGSDETSFVAQSTGADLNRATAWTRGILIFRGEPLSQAIDTVNLYSVETIRLIDPKLANMPIYGVINQGDTTALSELLTHPDQLEVAPKMESR